MKLVTYNIHYGFGRDGINDLDRIATAVDDADVIALQEIERFYPRSHMVDQVAALAKRFPNHWVAYGPNIDVFSPAGFPGEIDSSRRQFGNAIFSRRPILSQANYSLPRATGSEQTMRRGALEIVIDSDAGPVRIYSTHLDYLSPATRTAQLQALAARHDEMTAGGGPWEGTHAVAHEWLVGDEPATTPHAILLGDMNIAAGTTEHRDALERLPGFVDAWDALGHGTGGATKEGARIDHMWITQQLADRVMSGWVDHYAEGSDHQPTWFEMDI